MNGDIEKILPFFCVIVKIFYLCKHSFFNLNRQTYEAFTNTMFGGCNTCINSLPKGCRFNQYRQIINFLA